MTPETRGSIARALGLASAVLGAYVAYAHVLSWRRTAEYRAAPIVVDFAAKATLDAAFPVEDRGGLAHAMEGGALVVSGKCNAPGDAVTLRGQPTRLSSARGRMKAEIFGAAPVDVMAGVTSADAPPRELRFGLAASGEAAEARFVGDVLAHGPRAEGDRVLARAPEPRYPTTSDEGSDGGAPRPGTGRREIAFGLEPDLAVASGAIDGRIARTVPAGWATGERVQPTFTVTCRDASPLPVRVVVSEIAWEPLLRDVFTRDLDDRFTGSIFDTVWRVSRAEPEMIDTRITLGHGLDVRADARALFGLAPALTLVSPRFRAEPFRAMLDVEVEHLKQGAIVMGVANPYMGTPFFRTLDFGVFEKDGRLIPFASGHFQNDGQAAFRSFERSTRDLPAAKNAEVVLELGFDPESRKARGVMNGALIFDEAIALQPYEDTLFHVAVNADGAGASAALHVQRVRFSREHRVP